MHFARPAAARIQPRQDLLEKIRERQRDSPVNAINVAATLAHNKPLNRAFGPFAQAVLFEGGLSRRNVEIAVLRMGWNCQAVYEFGQHTVIGTSAGITDQEIERLMTEGVDGWSTNDAALVTATDELVLEHCLSDASWAALNRVWSTQQVLDLIFAVGQYTLVSTALRSLGVQLDEGAPGWPT